MVNSTVSGNIDPPHPGVDTYQVHLAGGTLEMINSTVVAPEPATLGFNIFVAAGASLVSTNSIIESGCSVIGSVVSGGWNIETPGDSCGLSDPTDLVNVTTLQLKLGPLQDNGGPTETHALLPGSVAIDVIPADMCEVDEDQRGEPRPGGTMCDVGSFEVQP
jgi:hypothetical protein